MECQEGGIQKATMNQPKRNLLRDALLASLMLACWSNTVKSVTVTEIPNMTDTIESKMSKSTTRVSLCWLAKTDYKFSIQHEQGNGLIQRFILRLIYYHFVGTTGLTENGISRSNQLDLLSLLFAIGILLHM